jgi:hypothetical protein
MNKRLKEILIRLLYFIPLVVFIIGLLLSLKELEFNSSIGMKYKYVFGIPIVIFAYQTIRNSQLGWILVMILYISFLGLWIYELIGEFSLIGAKYTYGQYLFWWIFVIIYLGLGVIYFKFRPKKKTI